MAEALSPIDWWHAISAVALLMAVLAGILAIRATTTYSREAAAAAAIATERADKIDRLLFSIDQRTMSLDDRVAGLEQEAASLRQALTDQHTDLAEKLDRLQGEVARHRRDLTGLRDEVVNQTTAKLQANETIAALLKRSP